MLPDLRFCLRAARRTPLFAVVAILTLGVAIGGTAAIYGFVRGILLAPLPYQDPDRLVVISSSNAAQDFSGMQVGAADLLALRERCQSFEGISGVDYRGVNLSGEGGPERVTAGNVLPDLLPLLGITPSLGRPFSRNDREGVAADEVILTDRLWKSRFGEDPKDLGGVIRVDGESRTIVGVLPPGAEIPLRKADLLLPYPLDRLRDASAPSLRVFARLRNDVALSSAHAEVRTLSRLLEEEGPPPPVTGWRMDVDSLRQEVVGKFEATLWILQAAVGLALLIACANFAGLLGARSTMRKHEIAVRRALGAGRFRIIRLLMTESVLLALAGGALSLVFTRWFTSVFVALAPEEIPRTSEVVVDGSLLGFGVGLALLSGVFAGLFPALLASRTSPEQSLRASSSSVSGPPTRWRDLLTALQFAAALSLVIGTGLLVQSLVRLITIDPGFDPKRVLSLQISFPRDRYPDAAGRTEVLSKVLDRLGALSGVESVAASSWMPMTGSYAKAQMSVEALSGSARERRRWPIILGVSPGFFRTMGIPLLQGGDVTIEERGDAPQRVVVNRELAEKAWPHESPLGRRIKYGGPRSDNPWFEVAGVAGNARLVGLSVAEEETMFGPLLPLKYSFPSIRVLIRSHENPETLAANLRRAIHELDDEMPVDQVSGIEELLSSNIAPERFYVTLLFSFTALAVGLAALGVYGITAQWTAARRREIGLRIALGADPWRVTKLVAARGLLLVTLGLASGVLASYGAVRFLTAMLYQVSPSDPATFAGAVMLLGGVGSVAVWLPARLAARIDPAATLKTD
jgi:putative ABC transport system permease protein